MAWAGLVGQRKLLARLAAQVDDVHDGLSQARQL